MDIEQQLHRAFAPCDPRPDLQSRILARASAVDEAANGSGRAGSRAILFSTLLAVAAAAAMLAWFLTREPAPQLAATVPVAAPAIEPAARVEAEPVPIEQAPAEPKVTKTVAPEQASPAVKTFTVQLLPLQNGAKDAAAMAAVDSFYTAFVEDLRVVPGLKLILPDANEPGEDALPDFQITINGGGSATSGKYSVAVMGDDKYFAGMKRKLISEKRDPGNGFAFGTSAQSDIAPSCIPVPGEDGPGCRTPATIAAFMVDSLRKRTFPQDPALQLGLQKNLLDTSLDPTRRLKALTDIGSLKSSSPGETLRDPPVVHGAIALAATTTDPAIRAQVWRAMRGSRNPDLVDPVIAALRQERDPEVRLQAVILLQEDFASDPRAREALEGISREESRPLVRALASRALNGETAWKEYIAASLKDTSRPDAERIEAFLYCVAKPGRTAGSVEFSSQVKLSDLLDDESIQALTRLLPEAAKSSEIKRSMSSILSQLGALNTPAITSMFMGMLEQATEPDFRHSVVAELSRHGSDPDAHAALEKISNEDPDADLRKLAASVLNGSSGGK